MTGDSDNKEEEQEEQDVVNPFFHPILTDVLEFRANLGPLGGERGYHSSSVDDNYAWYINGKFLAQLMKPFTKGIRLASIISQKCCFRSLSFAVVPPIPSLSMVVTSLRTLPTDRFILSTSQPRAAAETRK